MEKEWAILIALFKATCEQQTMLIGETKQQSKMIFNLWFKEGNKLLKLIEDNSNEDYLESITQSIENAIIKTKQNGI
jgi:hypothetical protein